MKRKIISLLIAVMLLLCACTSGGKTENRQNKTDGTLDLQMGLGSLNPLFASKQSVKEAMSLCFEPLFLLNDDLNPKGVLAESCKITDDSKCAIIKLKDCVLWHDGKRFTAGDVVYTINYLKENNESPYWFCVKYIDAASAIDTSTVKLDLSRPYAQIAYSLYFPIIAAHVKNPDEKMVGTGAYKLDKYTEASQLILKSNDSWHGGNVKIDRIVCSIMRDDITAQSAFNTGVIDAVTTKSIDLSNYSVKTGMRSTQYPSQEYEYMAFNHNNSLFASSSVRAAISQAIDRGEIVNEAYAAHAVAANVPRHPNCAMAPSPTYSEYNPGSAREMLFYDGFAINEKTGLMQNSSGIPLGFSITVNEENSQRQKCAQMIKQQLERLGITVNVESLPYEGYIQKIKSGQYDAYIASTLAGNLFDFEFLLSEGGALNNYGYQSRYIELALSSVASSPTKDSLENAVLNFDEIFMREQPIAGIAFLSDVLITSARIMGKTAPKVNFPYASIKDWSLKGSLQPK